MTYPRYSLNFKGHFGSCFHDFLVVSYFKCKKETANRPTLVNSCVFGGNNWLNAFYRSP